MPVADYAIHKERAAARNREMSQRGRDIGSLPPVVDPERRELCRLNLRLFLETYFKEIFCYDWSPDHLKAIDLIEQAVLRGALFALAMPRASGKTSLCECACLWAALYGHHQFICVIGSDEDSAKELLQSVKTQIETNELLLEDFPEVCCPVVALDGQNNRANGQTYQGERTCITWTDKKVVLPTIEGSAASEVVINTRGITGRIRGMKHTRRDGSSARPSLVIVDDPQTDESARSVTQCERRERTLAGAVLGLAGPGKKISGIMPCTVIVQDDMADKILNRDKHPYWNGQRTKMLYQFPANMELWDQYRELREDGFRAGDYGAKANRFYKKNRKQMDEWGRGRLGVPVRARVRALRDSALHEPPLPR